MNFKKWTLSFLLFSFIGLGGTGFINYVIDPFNIFSHKNALNSLSIGFNERLQKSAYLKFNSQQDYDSILFGSSRATYYNERKFKNFKLFNFSFSGAMPIEYDTYLRYAKTINKIPFNNIILGLDFYTFKKNSKKIEFYNINNKFLFFIKHYFSFDTLKYSIINIKRSILQTTGHRSYTRNNIVKSDHIKKEKVHNLAIKRSKNYYVNFHNSDGQYYEILNDLKKQNNNSNFIVYTSPLSKPFLNIIYTDKKLLKLYFRWIETLVSVFDQVYFFTLPSELSNNYEKYSIDGDHYYPKVGEKIADIILCKKSIKNYGIIINTNNLAEVVSNMKKELIK